jgi:hypothetical protein
VQRCHHHAVCSNREEKISGWREVMVGWSYFFLSKTDGLPTEIKRRGKRLIHFTNIGAMMQSCKRRGKNGVSAHNRGKYAIIPKIYNAIYATHTASEESSSENQESGPFVAFHSRLLYARESIQIERKIMPN